jgi:oxygen-independent coproporphyrinogen-3 oxidase
MPQLSWSPSPPQSLYVHVPFCARKCSYCAFYSESSSGEQIRRYLRALIREMELATDGLRPDTVFFGGGTPSLLNLRQWELILDALRRRRLGGATEWTVECNPATLSLDKARLLRDHGVNRVSLGVQSLDESLLERLGRVHSRAMVFESVDLLRKAGFDNLNLDLMFAIPGQTLGAWRRTLAEALSLGSEHLSCYEVIYEEDTPLFHQLQAGEFDADEDLACDMYQELLDQAGQAGFQQYEIANFARDDRRIARAPEHMDAAEPAGGPVRALTLQSTETQKPAAALPRFACRHNINYWRGGSFLGLGPSATSYVGGARTRNLSNTQLYCEQLEQGLLPIESREQLPPLARAGETAAFGLRLVNGWAFEEFQRATGEDLRREWSRDMSDLIDRGWGARTPERFGLTGLGLRFADAAGELFLR